METSCDRSDPPPPLCGSACRHGKDSSSLSFTPNRLQSNTDTDRFPSGVHTIRSHVVFTCGGHESEDSVELNSEDASDSSSTAPYLATGRVLPEPPTPCSSSGSSPCLPSGMPKAHVGACRSHAVRQNHRRQDRRANFHGSSARPSLPSIGEDRIVVLPVCPRELRHDAQRLDSSSNSGYESALSLSSHGQLPVSGQSLRRMQDARRHSESLYSSGSSGEDWSTSSGTSFMRRRQHRLSKSGSRKWPLMLGVACIFVVVTAAFLVVTVMTLVQRDGQKGRDHEEWNISNKILEILKPSHDQDKSKTNETCLPCLELFCTEVSSRECQDLRLLQNSLDGATLACCTRNPYLVTLLLSMVAEKRRQEILSTVHEAVLNATASLTKPKPGAYATVVVKKSKSPESGLQEAILRADHHFAGISDVSLIHNRLYIHRRGVYLVSGQVLFRMTSGKWEDDLTLIVKRFNDKHGKAQVLTESRYTPPGGQDAPVWYRTVTVVLPTLLEEGDELALLVSPQSLVSHAESGNYFAIALVSSVSARK